MKRRDALHSLSLLALPGLLSACGGPDEYDPNPPPPPTPADRWTPGLLLNSSSFSSGAQASFLQADGPERMLALVGSGSDLLAYGIHAGTGAALALQGPAGFPGIMIAAPDMRGGVLRVWQRPDTTPRQLLYALSDGSSGQIGPVRTVPVDPSTSLQAWLLAQDATGNALVRWAGGPLDNSGQPTQGGLLQFSASTQLWQHLPLPNPAASPILLLSSGSVFDATGRAWLIQPTPGAVAGEWTLALYSLPAQGSSWQALGTLPASSARSAYFQLGMDASGRLFVAHSMAYDPTGAAPLISLSRYEPTSARWSTLPAPNLPLHSHKLSVDSLGNVWLMGPSSFARYDNERATWTGPKEFDFAPADAFQRNGEWPLAVATDSRGHAWAVGVRRKVAGQDLPTLWINFFDAGTRQWSQAGSLGVQGGENPGFVQPAQGEGNSYFQVALGIDSQGRPVATVTELLRASLAGGLRRTWVARGQAV